MARPVLSSCAATFRWLPITLALDMYLRMIARAPASRSREDRSRREPGSRRAEQTDGDAMAGSIIAGGNGRSRIGALVLAMILLAVRPGVSAERDGVSLPDRQQVNGVTLYLNGVGVRTYSVLQVHIYVAGLYLTHPSSNADQILRSGETKLLSLYFLHDVTAEQARTAWREG